VIVTGGGGKFAKAYALGFANEGAQVAFPRYNQRRSRRPCFSFRWGESDVMTGQMLNVDGGFHFVG
jgi:NAD(P)-dependent dehydrogenase (short-subunit alcohol dehydrogenase family)